MSKNVLVVDDDTAFQAMLRDALSEKGFATSGVESAEAALDLLEERSFDFVLLDVQLPGITGIEALDRILAGDSRPDVIVMTAYSDKDTALTAISKGAYDYFSKPFSLREMEIVLSRAMERRHLQEQVRSLKETLRKGGPLERIVGRGPAMARVVEMIERVAPLDATVLVTGESGTGKGLIADTIHSLSPRADGPFVKINCAAIPENLLESELFGFEKGAFTGALKQTPGKFELADRGTLLLDEIGDMPLSLQPKLLRVVEDKQAERLGGGKAVSFDTRIVAATNQDLEGRIAEKAFREDLFYRLNVAAVNLPPLRERREDIPELTEFFLERIAPSVARDGLKLAPEAMRMVAGHHWPGNVRQLANVLERAAIAARGATIGEEEMEYALASPSKARTSQGLTDGESLRDRLNRTERELILDALSRVGGRQTEASRLLGITPKNLWNKLQKHGIDPKSPS